MLEATIAFNLHQQRIYSQSAFFAVSPDCALTEWSPWTMGLSIWSDYRKRTVIAQAQEERGGEPCNYDHCDQDNPEKYGKFCITEYRTVHHRGI